MEDQENNEQNQVENIGEGAPVGAVSDPSLEESNDIVFVDVEMDNNDRATLFEQFFVNKVPSWTKSKYGHRYKGMVLRSLLILGQDDDGIFLGIDDPGTIPEGWRLRLKFRYDLLGPKQEVIKQGILFNHTKIYIFRVIKLYNFMIFI
jgi:hypothetical protein